MRKSEFEQQKILWKKDEYKALNLLQQEKREFERNYQVKQEECEEIIGELNKMKENKKEIEVKLVENESNFMNLQKKYQINEKNLREKENEVRNITNSFNKSQENLTENQLNFSKLKEIFKKNETENQEKYGDLQEKLKEKIKIIEHLEAEIHNFTEKIQGISQEKNQLETLINVNLEKNSMEILENNENFFEEINNLKKKIMEMKNFEDLFNKAQNELFQKKNEISQLKKDLIKTKEISMNLEEKLKKNEKEACDLKQKLENSEKNQKKIIEDSQKYQKETKEISNTLKELKGNCELQNDSLFLQQNEEIRQYQIHLGIFHLIFSSIF